jgi:hypothetical protein
MIKIEYINEVWTIKNKWSEITIAEYESLMEIPEPAYFKKEAKALEKDRKQFHTKHEKLIESAKGQSKTSLINKTIDKKWKDYDKANYMEVVGSFLDYWDEIKTYLLKLFKILGNDIDFTNNYWNEQTISQMYYYGINDLVNGIIDKSKVIKTFKLDKKTYKIIDDIKLLGTIQLSGKGTAKHLVNLLDLSKVENKGMGGIVSIMTSEKFSTEEVIERAEYFTENLTMDVAWNIFFCCSKLLNTSAKTISTFFQKVKPKAKITII